MTCCVAVFMSIIWCPQTSALQQELKSIDEQLEGLLQNTDSQ